MNTSKIMCYYAIAVIISFGTGLLAREYLDERQASVEAIFDLCYHGANLIKEGQEYMVICLPINYEESKK